MKALPPALVKARELGWNGAGCCDAKRAAREIFADHTAQDAMVDRFMSEYRQARQASILSDYHVHCCGAY